MLRRKTFGSALLSAVLLATVALAPAWSANARKPLSFHEVHVIQMRFANLLPHWRLGNVWAAHQAYLKNAVKSVADADTTQFGAGKVDFHPGNYPKPYTTDTENRAMFELGVMASYAHFCIVNAYSPQLKQGGVSIIKSLASIAQSTDLTAMSGDLNAIAQQVSDPSFQGGPGPALDRFDRIADGLTAPILKDYHTDGLWYYTAGVTLGALSLIPPTDQFNAPYFRNMLALLYNHYPTPDLSYPTRNHIAQLLRGANYSHYSIKGGPKLAWWTIQDIYTFPK